MKKKSILCSFLILLFSVTVFVPGVISVSAREEEPDPYDLSIYMDKSIYDAQMFFQDAEPVPARGFSLFMQLGEIGKDDMVEAGMTAYSETGIVRSVQINHSDGEYNIFGIHCGMALSDAVDLLLDCHYSLKSSQRNKDGSYEDEYSSYMDLYTLYLSTDSEANVTNLFLKKNVS